MNNITNEQLQDIINPINEKMEEVIDAFVQVYGEQYRGFITKTINKTIFVTALPTNHYVLYVLESCFQNKDINLLNAMFKKYGINFKTNEKYSEDNLSNMEEMANIILNIANIPVDAHFKMNFNKLNAKLIDFDKNNQLNHGIFKNSKFDYSTYPDEANENWKNFIRLFNELDTKKAKIYALALDFKKDWDEFCSHRYTPLLNQFQVLASEIRKQQKKLEDDKIRIKNQCLTRFYERYEEIIEQENQQDSADRDKYAGLIADLIETFTNATNEDADTFLNDLMKSESFNLALKNLGVNEKYFHDKQFLKKLFYDNTYVKSLTKLADAKSELIFYDPIFASAIERMEKLMEDLSSLKTLIDNNKGICGYTTCCIDEKKKDIHPIVTMLSMSNTILIHEIAHCLGYHFENDYPTRGFYTYFNGFKRFACRYNHEDSHKTTKKERPQAAIEIYSYTGFDEVVNEYLSGKVCEVLKNKGVSLYNNGYAFDSLYREVFPFYEEFLEKYQSVLVKYLMSDDPLRFTYLVGQEVFDRLAEATNKILFDSHLQNESKEAMLEYIEARKTIVTCLDEMSATLDNKISKQENSIFEKIIENGKAQNQSTSESSATPPTNTTDGEYLNNPTLDDENDLKV